MSRSKEIQKSEEGVEAERKVFLEALVLHDRFVSAARQATEAALEAAKNFERIRFPAGFSDTFVPPALFEHWVKAHAPTNQIHRINALAISVIGDEVRALNWLKEPNPATDNRAPIELLGEPQGYERVTNLLLRIEYGVLA